MRNVRYFLKKFIDSLALAGIIILAAGLYF